MFENLKGYKTLVFGMAIAALGAVKASGLAEIVPPEYVGLVMTVVGIVIVYLRSVTNTAITKSQ
jgi:hypothetical protein